MEAYRESLLLQVNHALEVAKKARIQFLDPSPEVEIPLAEDIAARVESLVATVEPKLLGSGVKERLRELEAKYGKNDEHIGFDIAKEVAENKFVKFKTLEDQIDGGLRVGVAYLTLGIVTAPLEGITRIAIKQRRDGGNYLSIYFSGPIRSAGGTAAAMAVLIGDYLRQLFNIGVWDPSSEEIERYVVEVDDYDRIANLQYRPSNEKIRFILERIPVEINGEPTEKMDVLSFKDLARIETNRIRGGMCLTLCEGVASKAPKLYKRTKKYGSEYKLEAWEWLKDVKPQVKATQDSVKVRPNFTFIEEIPAGRPVFSDPSEPGGFRLRYGRSRNTGLAGIGLSPATMVILSSFPAVGTQLRVERPGKAAVVAPVDSIRGPVVLLKDGTVLGVNTEQQAKKVMPDIREILFVGDMLVGPGEFSNNGHILLPSAWCEEWWMAELDKAKGASTSKDPFTQVPDPAIAWDISVKTGIPLHPQYTYAYHLVSADDLKALYRWLQSGQVKLSGGKIVGWEGENGPAKRTLELIWAPHQLINNKVILGWEALPLLSTLGYPGTKLLDSDKADPMEAIAEASPVKLHKLAPTFIGARMGRPEKAEHREMRGKPMVLFPVTEAGGRLRSVNCAAEGGKIHGDLALRICKECGKRSFYLLCQHCGGKTKQRRICRKCRHMCDSDIHCGMPTTISDPVEVNLCEDFGKACQAVGFTPELLKGVKGMSSSEKIPERLEKGILRAKHNLLVNKEGTIRFDSTDVPLTHFTPKEIGVGIERLRGLGYAKDVKGAPLERDDQVLELYPQDILIADHPQSSCVDWLLRVCAFVDELLVKFYHMEPYYNVKRKDDLVGQLVVGLAPHTSAGIIGRVIGFTKARVGFAHPIWHAGKRRNCDGDEDSVLLLLDAFLNFSRLFLPNTRGGKTMDAPLVLTTIVDAQEVDDEVRGLDTAWSIPLEFYHATLSYADADAVKMRRIKDQLENTMGEGFTHPTSQIDAGPVVSSYTALGTMLDKVEEQLDLGRRIYAVDENREAETLISSHFLKDIKGNIRTYCRQSFRCTKCNKIYRRIPLLGGCTCGGNLVLTVAQGSVEKYLKPSQLIAERFHISEYMKQELRIVERRIKAMFGIERETQKDLSSFLG